MITNQRISQAAERTTWALTSTPVLGPLLVLLYGVTVAACLVIVTIITIVIIIVIIIIILTILFLSSSMGSP